MVEITIELAKHPGKYSFQKLPRILKGQFGKPKPVHWKAWAEFKSQYDLYEQQAPPLPSEYKQSIQQILAIEPKPIIIPEDESA